MYSNTIVLGDYLCDTFSHCQVAPKLRKSYLLALSIALHIPGRFDLETSLHLNTPCETNTLSVNVLLAVSPTPFRGPSFVEFIFELRTMQHCNYFTTAFSTKEGHIIYLLLTHSYYKYLQIVRLFSKHIVHSPPLFVG